jgi:hypothetical protein
MVKKMPRGMDVVSDYAQKVSVSFELNSEDVVIQTDVLAKDLLELIIDIGGRVSIIRKIYRIYRKIF